MTDEKRSDTVLKHFACRASQYGNHYPINVANGQTEIAGKIAREQPFNEFTDTFACNDPSLYYSSPIVLSGSNFACGKRLRYSCLADGLRQ